MLGGYRIGNPMLWPGVRSLSTLSGEGSHTSTDRLPKAKREPKQFRRSSPDSPYAFEYKLPQMLLNAKTWLSTPLSECQRAGKAGDVQRRGHFEPGRCLGVVVELLGRGVHGLQALGTLGV